MRHATSGHGTRMAPRSIASSGSADSSVPHACSRNDCIKHACHDCTWSQRTAKIFFHQARALHPHRPPLFFPPCVCLRAHSAFLATAAHDSHALNPSDSWVIVLSAVACSSQDKTRSTGRHRGHSTFELAGRWLVDGTKNPARMCCPSLFRSAPVFSP